MRNNEKNNIYNVDTLKLIGNKVLIRNPNITPDDYNDEFNSGIIGYIIDKFLTDVSFDEYRVTRYIFQPINGDRIMHVKPDSILKVIPLN